MELIWGLWITKWKLLFIGFRVRAAERVSP